MAKELPVAHHCKPCRCISADQAAYADELILLDDDGQQPCSYVSVRLPKGKALDIQLPASADAEAVAKTINDALRAWVTYTIEAR